MILEDLVKDQETERSVCILMLRLDLHLSGHQLFHLSNRTTAQKIIARDN